jgi:flagellar basal body L-ring protein FlgH
MALSMDEQRILAEIERRLAAEDPGLAARMSSFRRPGPANVFRSARARVIGSLLTVVVVAMVSLMVYAMLPFRSNTSRTMGGHPVASRGQPVMTVSSAGSGGAKAGPAKTPANKVKSSSTARATGATTGHSPAAHTTAKAAHTNGSPSAAANANPASPALRGP